MNKKNFWKKLKKPIFVLAPMADVTDYAFRSIIAKYGHPDVFWTEFVSADGLAHEKGREKLLIDLKYSKKEKPIVAQIFGSNPENIKKASSLCEKLGFSGVDVNMGCPDRAVLRQGAGADLIRNPKLAKEIIRAMKEGAPSLPVSVKTRIGFNKNEIGDSEKGWIKELLEEDIDVLTVHLRTKKEMSLVPAHWELMSQVVKIRDEMGKDTLILGNGDVVDMEDGRRKCEETGCDGVMLGRAIFGNPFLFSKNKKILSEIKERNRKLKVMVEHTKLFEKMLVNPPAGGKNFAIMKKHYKAYVNGFDGAKELRVKLMEASNAKEVSKIVNDFLSKKC